MSIESNNKCQSLLQIASYYQITNHPQYTLSGNYEEKDDVLCCIKDLWNACRDDIAASLGLKHIMGNMEKNLFTACCSKFQINPVNLAPENKEILFINNVKILFRKLAEELHVPVDFNAWSELQNKWEKESLIQLWDNEISPRLNAGELALSKAEEISAWLRGPENAVHLLDCLGIDLHDRAIKAIPPEVINFIALKKLQLPNNKIKFIPDFLSSIPNLEYLNLNNNLIYGIPDSISTCKNLTRIDLSENIITNIPDAIGKLTTLKILNLSHNKITRIPNAISMLTNLEELNLSYNKIICISSSLLSLRKLYYLNLFVNPLPHHLDDIKRYGCKFFKALIIGGEKKDLELVQEFLSKVEALNEYKCIGSFSNFIRFAMNAASLDRHDLIKEAFNKNLNTQDKDLICEAYFSIKNIKIGFNHPHDHEFWKDDLLFKDMDIFFQAALKAIELKYKSLMGPAQRATAFQNGEPSIEDSEIQCQFDNVLEMSDSLESFMNT